MKYSLISFIRKAVAAIVSAIMTFIGILFPQDKAPDRPDANSVTEYNVSSADYSLDVDAGNELYDISDLLFGIFFEDINFAADGGLYAERQSTVLLSLPTLRSAIRFSVGMRLTVRC